MIVWIGSGGIRSRAIACQGSDTARGRGVLAVTLPLSLVCRQTGQRKGAIR